MVRCGGKKANIVVVEKMYFQPIQCGGDHLLTYQSFWYKYFTRYVIKNHCVNNMNEYIFLDGKSNHMWSIKCKLCFIQHLFTWMQCTVVVYTAKGLFAFETTVRDINHQFCYGSMAKYLKHIDIIEFHTLCNNETKHSIII